MKPSRLTALALACGLSAYLGFWYLSVSTEAANPKALPPLDLPAVTQTFVAPSVTRLADDLPLRTTLAGNQAEQSANQTQSAATLLAAADLDEDGTPDLISAYSTGQIVWQQGNVDSPFPNTKAANTRRAQGRFSEQPFSAETQVLSVPEAPQFLATGDFNADGHRDILTSAYGTSSFYLLAGNGRGEFAAAQRFGVSGRIEAIATGEIGRPDGQTDIAIAVSDENHSRLLVYEHPEGAFKRAAEEFALSAAPTAIAIGHLDTDGLGDVAVACGDRLVFIHGHQQIYPWDMIRSATAKRPSATRGERRLGFRIHSIAIGNFNAAKGAELAMLADDGFVHLLTSPAVGPVRKQQKPNTRWLRSAARPTGTSSSYQLVRNDVVPGPQEQISRGYQMLRRDGADKNSSRETTNIVDGRRANRNPRSRVLSESFKTAPSRIAEWTESVWFSGLQFSSTAGSRQLFSARVSGSEFDDLIGVDKASQQILIVGTLANRAELLSSLQVNGTPTAILPLRLNSDALSDLVIAHSGSASPSVVTTGPASTYTVNTTDDTGGPCQPGDTCSLRGAIQAANFNPGPDTITFAIPGDGVQTISLATELPVIGGPVTIDATTQPGYEGTPVIEISGDALGSAADGLKVRASDCVVRGFAINLMPHFEDENGSFHGGNGISLESLANQTRHTNNFVESNFLGTNAFGDEDRGNTSTGLIIFDSDNNTIGGTVAAARNVISGNGNQDEPGAGISMVNGNNNQFKGNYIGVDASGTSKLGNSLGFDLTGSFNTVGGDEAGSANTISGNGEPNLTFPDRCGGNGVGSGLGITAIFPSGESTNLTNFNNIKGNFIGTDSSGTEPLGNCGFGIATTPVTGTQIGSIAEGGRNVISDNGHYAVNCSYINSFPLEGGFCIVSGNNIGTDISGTLAMRNDGRNILPGLSPIFGVVTAEAVEGAFASIGAPGGTTPGGSCTGFCNLISGNDGGDFQHDAVMVFGVGLNGVFNSYIGTDIDGTSALPNNTAGFMGGNSFLGSLGFVGGAPDDLTPLGNLISGNSCGGFRLQTCVGNCEALTTVSVQNNLIGTDVTGMNALPNTTTSGCGNAGIGAAGSLGSFVFIGGTAHPLERNVVSGNAFDALHLQGNTVVQNNYIGVAFNGTTPLGNTGHGIKLLAVGGEDRPNVIGGSGTNESNIIRNSGGAGIFMDRYFMPQVATIADVRANSIFNNSGLGIDIFPLGVNSNDAGDVDAGPNELQNFPLLDAPVFNGNGTVTIHGWLNSLPSSSYRIDFYASTVSDPTKYGEGQTFVGSTSVNTDNQGRVEFTVTSSGTVSSSQKITATATDAGGRTSEFSCAGGECIADVGVSITDDPDPVAAGTSLSYTLDVSNAGPATATNVIATNTLPASVNFDSVTTSQGSCSRSGVTVTCNLGTINVGGNATITIQVTPTTEGEITNTATTTRAQEDPNPDNDSDTEHTQVGPAVIIVTTNGDESDADLNDNICDVDPQTPESQCTLRAAIEVANSRAGRDAIAFDIPGGPNQTISPQSALPTISQSVSIDATTQPGFADLPVILLNGSSAGGDAFKITAGNCYLAGFAITRYSGNGIYIQGGPGGNVIEGNIIGTDANGTDNIGLGGAAVLVENSPNNQIGRGAGAQARLNFVRVPYAPNLPLGNISNVIGRSFVGVKISGASAIGNVLKANLIGGVLRNGLIGALPNVTGILVQFASQTTIGGTGVLDSCTILASNGPGIKIESLAEATRLINNFIGTTASGDANLGNNGPGVLIEGANETEVGGQSASMGNIISGNNGPGISVQSLANALSDLTKIFNNGVGTLRNLNQGLRNVGDNVVADGASNLTIESNNIVGSQTGCGVLLKDTQGLLTAGPSEKPNARRNRKQALNIGSFLNKNVVGLLSNLNFSQPFANALGGICVDGVPQVTIGGLLGNVIAGNSGPGVRLFGQQTQGFKLLGNIIGTNRDGLSGLGNFEGILIQGARKR